MKLPISWLKEYVDIGDITPIELCEKLVNAGFEVEEIIYRGEGMSNVVVGRILDISKHPDADKLLVCRIDIGKEVLQIVTGAPNVFIGAVVPVATHNSYLPCGKHITRGSLRGVESNGMLCGGEELCVTEDIYHGASVDGILILNDNEIIGEDMVKVLGLDDYVLDISITANRPDCGSVYGMCREIAGILGNQCKELDLTYNITVDKDIKQYVNVKVYDVDLCTNYAMSVVDNVTIAQSPLWLTRRLSAVGLRGINNLVDITNYVLIELGQPMHAFDYADITDKTIIVRRANKGENITLLDDKEYSLGEQMLVIADKTKPVGLAGIMGGVKSGIKQDTKTVAFESAIFAKGSIRHTSKDLNVRSDSSARFERGLDDYTSLLALDRALHLVQQLKCGQVVKGQIKIGEYTGLREIKFDKSRIVKLLGIEVPDKDIVRILNGLGILATIEKTTLNCIIPPYRADLTRPCDLIEEIIRIYGYSHITPTLLEDCRITIGGRSSVDTDINKIKGLLVSCGYNEIVTYSFGGRLTYEKLSVDKNADLSNNIKLLNPLGEEFSLMRRTLVADMLEVIAGNQSRHNEQLSLFELAKVYLTDKLPLESLPIEQRRLCVASTCQDAFYTVKDDLLSLLARMGIDASVTSCQCEYLHPNISASLMCGDRVIGSVGLVHPTVADNYNIKSAVCVAELDVDTILSVKDDNIKYKSVPRFPAIERDFALVADIDMQSGKIIELIRKYCKHSESARVFDVYCGDQVGNNKKSIAINVVFRGEGTLTDSDIEGEIKKCLSELNRQLNVVLRV